MRELYTFLEETSKVSVAFFYGCFEGVGVHYDCDAGDNVVPVLAVFE